MKIKTSEATNTQLDWLVAKCEGRDIRPGRWRGKFSSNGGIWKPSENWSQGGPIIEREKIELHVLASGLDVAAHTTYTPGDAWEAKLWPADLDIIQICGPTPLIAAMRAYVTSKLGDEVEVPDELA